MNVKGRCRIVPAPAFLQTGPSGQNRTGHAGSIIENRLPLPISLSYANRSAVRLHKLLGDGQAETAALHLRPGYPEVTLENALVVAWVDAASEILNVYFYGLVVPVTAAQR